MMIMKAAFVPEDICSYSVLEQYYVARVLLMRMHGSMTINVIISQLLCEFFLPLRRPTKGEYITLICFKTICN